MLATLGYEYDVLGDAVKQIKDVPGLTLEIGLCQGGGTKLILDSLLANEDYDRTHIAIDPYGSMPYVLIPNPFDFSSDMMKRTLAELYTHVIGKPVYFLFFPLEDTEFMDRFADGVPVYKNKHMKLENTYALVFFDGPHTTDNVLAETVFFASRAANGAMFVYDDIYNLYNHNAIEAYLLANGFETVSIGQAKAVYKCSTS